MNAQRKGGIKSGKARKVQAAAGLGVSGQSILSIRLDNRRRGRQMGLAMAAQWWIIAAQKLERGCTDVAKECRRAAACVTIVFGSPDHEWAAYIFARTTDGPVERAMECRDAAYRAKFLSGKLPKGD